MQVPGDNLPCVILIIQ